MVSEPVILKQHRCVSGDFHPTHKQAYQENCHDDTPEHWNNETKHKEIKKNYVYTVKYMKSSSPDDSSLMQHAIIPTLPPSLLPLPSRPLPTSHTSPFQKQIVGYPSWYLGFRAGGGLETGHTPAWDVSQIAVYPCPVGMGFFPTVRVGVILLL